MRTLALVALTAMMVTSVAYVAADAIFTSNDDPMSVHLFDFQGEIVENNLLDKTSVEISTHTDADTGITTFTIEEGTPLVSETRYLHISPDAAGECTLDLTTVFNYGFLTETGITIAFYTDTSYSDESFVGQLTYTKDSVSEQTLSSLLTAGQNYYVRAWTASDYVQTEIQPSSSFSVDLTFVATTGDGVNAVFYYVNDGSTEDPIQSKLVVNGQLYGDMPEVSVEGWTLLGWFTDPVMGAPVKSGDTVNLTDSQNLYAHWIKTGSEVIHVEDEFDDVWIWIDVTDDNTHVKIAGESKSERVITVYDQDVIDGVVVVDTHNTAADFLVQDAIDANMQYETVKQVLTERHLIVESFIIINYNDEVSCEEGSLAKLLDTDCNDFRVVGDALTISMDRGVLQSLKGLTGEIIIEVSIASADRLTEAQRKTIGDNDAYEIRILNNGIEIWSFKGTITAWFDYDAPKNMKSMQIYCVFDDGSTEPIIFTYEDGRVIFKTTHLSVYYLDVEKSSNSSMIWILGILIIIMLGLILLLLIAKRRKDEEEKYENEAP